MVKYWLVVWRSKDAGGGERMAQTADMGLVRTVIAGLHTNFAIEDDEQDRIFSSEFIRTAPAVAAQLTREICQAASCEWPEEGNEENGVADSG